MTAPLPMGRFFNSNFSNKERFMIYPISNVFSSHFEIIAEEENDFTSFMDRLFNTMTKYELSFFKSADGRIYRAKLISRQDIKKETKITIHSQDLTTSYVAKRCIQVILEYRFTEIN